MNLIEIVAEVFVELVGYVFYRFDQADWVYWPYRRSVRRESIRAGEEGGIYTWCRNFIGDNNWVYFIENSCLGRIGFYPCL